MDKDPALVTDNGRNMIVAGVEDEPSDEPSSYVRHAYIESSCPDGLSCEQCCEGAWKSEEGGRIFPSEHNGGWAP